jgi:hypothetical protein
MSHFKAHNQWCNRPEAIEQDLKIQDYRETERRKPELRDRIDLE